MAKHKVVINACIGEFGLSGKKLPSLEWDYLFGGVLAPNGRIYKTDKGDVTSSPRIQGLTTIDLSMSLNCLNINQGETDESSNRNLRTTNYRTIFPSRGFLLCRDDGNSEFSR